MPKIEANDCEFYYERIGEGDEPLLFLNGILMNTQTWGQFIESFSEDYDILLHDFRGQLRSEKPAGKYTMELHADDVNALMEKLDIDSAHIVGTSYGSEVGMILSYKYPEKVKSLTIAAGTSELDERIIGFAKIWKIGAQFAYEQDAKTEFYDLLEPTFFSAEYMEKNREMLNKRREQVAGLPDEFFEGFERLTNAFMDLDITENLDKIKAPTLIIVGGEDIIKRRKFGELIAEKVPNSELSVIEDVGHAFILESPQEFIKMVTEFLDKVRDDKYSE